MALNEDGQVKKPRSNPNISEVVEKFAGDPQLEKISKAEKAAKLIPEGYVEVRLSTKGLIAAPEVFHIRNFGTEDLLKLGVSDQEDLPLRVIDMLDGMIFEDDVRVSDFVEKEVIELLLFVYESFYGDGFYSQTYPLDDEDWDYLAEKCGGKDSAEFRARERAIKNEEWKPQFDIKLSEPGSSVQYFDVDPNIKTNARIRKESGFECVYGLSKFGDVLEIKKFMDAEWKERDKQFAAIGDIIKRRQEAEDKAAKGENINLRAIPDAPKAERQKYKEYEIEKSIYAMQAIRALHLKEVTGTFTDGDGNQMRLDHEDVSSWPMSKKMVLAKHPELDYQTFAELKERTDALEFGLKPKIIVKDPIKDEVRELEYSFRLDFILQNIRDKRSTKTTISFE
jgi:hypothetical protein